MQWLSDDRLVIIAFSNAIEYQNICVNNSGQILRISTNEEIGLFYFISLLVFDDNPKIPLKKNGCEPNMIQYGYKSINQIYMYNNNWMN